MTRGGERWNYRFEIGFRAADARVMRVRHRYSH
jgi:hypothetical protein